MEQREIAGYPVKIVERAGREYVYALDYPNIERIEASIDLSASHDDGEVVRIAADPDLYPAQDAYFSSGAAQSSEFITSMAELIDGRFRGLLDRILADPVSAQTLRLTGERMAAGQSVFHSLPHGSLLDIGLLHAATMIALQRLGFEFRAGILISHGVAGRGRQFGEDVVCLADALDWACDKVWYVTPRTENARESRYIALVPSDHVDNHNAIVRADLAETLTEGGFLVTIAPSATSYRVDATGHAWLAPASLGTLRLMSHPNAAVLPVAGRILGRNEPAYSAHLPIVELRGDAASIIDIGADLMRGLADEMTRLDPTTTYGVR